MMEISNRHKVVCSSPRTNRFGWSTSSLATVLTVAVCFAVAGCSSGVDVTFNLINPCDPNDMVLHKDNQCQFMQLSISSLDPNDDLHPSKMADGFGPIARTCGINDGNCNISGDDLVGNARVVDILCYTSLETNPVARATSQAMAFYSGQGGVGSVTLNLLIGNINEFVDTTIVKRNSDNIGTCSLLGQGEIGRYGHAATLLADGRVLITGGIRRYGQGVEEILATAEIFDPETGEHRLITDSNGSPIKMRAEAGRAFHTATRLRGDQGLILIAGGIGLVEGKWTALASSELFDPATETFPENFIAVMGSGRANHAATTLATGEVLLTGGASYDNGNITSYYKNAIKYLPAENRWVPVNSNMSVARAFHAAVLLDPTKYNGNVVVIGGENADGPHNSIDIYNALGDQFYNNVNVVMAKNRSHLCAVGLDNGEIMVAGGKTTVDDTSVDTGVEIYDPAVPDFGQFTGATINLQVARMKHTCSLLQTGNVLVAGGKTSSEQGIGIGELVLVGSGTYSVQQLDDFLDPARFSHTATVLRNGWVYIAGGLQSAAPEAVPLTQSVFFVPRPAY